MNKPTYFLLLALILTAPKSYADADQDYKNLCSYDGKWCGKIKNSDGTWVKPKKEIVKLLKELAPAIQKHAATLGVDPQAIAGAIMAENSLNVSISDGVQDLLVKIGVANKGEILGKKFTYGLGQLNYEAAREAENYVAKLEGRTPAGQQELSESLLIPEKAIYYVGAVLKKCQDDYKKQGIDIADKPEILTTLYNLGGSGSKARELKNSGATPRPNYFGFFVKRYQSDLAFLKTEPVKPLEPALKVATSKKARALPPAVIAAKVAAEAKELKLAFTKSMPLYSAPPTCDTQGNYGATDLKSKYSSMKVYAVTAIADKEKSFQVIAPTIDCEANTWELIKLSSGESGWIKKDDLDKTTAQMLIAKSKCAPKTDAKCSEQVKEKIKDSIIADADNSKGEIFVSPFTKGKKAAFKNPDWQCADPQASVAGASAGYSSGSFGGFGFTYTSSGGGGYAAAPSAPTKKIGKPINSDEVLKEIISKIDQKEKAIEAFYKAPLSDPRNPYSGSPFGEFKKGIEKCVNKQIYHLDSCPLDLSQVEKLLSAMELKPKVSKDDRAYLGINMQAIPYGNPFATKDQVLSAMKSNPYGFFNPAFMGGGGFSGGYGYATLNSQYAFREGDETLWKIEDVDQAFKECDVSLTELTNKITLSKNLDGQEQQAMLSQTNQLQTILLKTAKDALATLKEKPDSEKEKLWSDVQGEFVQASKVCLSLAENFDLSSKKNYDQSALQNYNCFYQNLSILEENSALMLKDVVKETMFTGSGMQMLFMQASIALNASKLMNMGLIPNPFASMGAAPVKPAAPVEIPPSYCPNKTAEMIEELVKNNPCVTTVYIPDKWLLNRLNELGSKVVYRPFAEDDRFSFELESAQCK